MSADDLIIIYRWADGTWCEPEELEDMLTWKSDDFEVLSLTLEEFQDLL
jgi:hypothetical protein